MVPLVIGENVPLADFTTLGVGGPARYFAEAEAASDVLGALEYAHARNLPLFVLGGGSNILVSDRGFHGLVLRICLRGVEDHGHGEMTVAAGENWDGFVRRCVGSGLRGLECLSGIPGSVGGTPIQNVGAYGQEVSETILSVRTLERGSGRIRELTNSECAFSYRQSIFNSKLHDTHIVLAVRFGLCHGGPPALRHGEVARFLSADSMEPTLEAVREAVLRIRSSKGMVLDPGNPDSRSAGSFFKNPVLSPAEVRLVEERARRGGCLEAESAMPRFPAPNGQEKVPAAWLIEKAGFRKGYRRGRAAISSRHALALVNCGGATAGEILELMREIQGRVAEVYGVELVPEPVFVGFDEGQLADASGPEATRPE